MTPRTATDGGSGERVGCALEHEETDDMTALRAYRAGDAKFTLPLGGEHHEDKGDEEDARHDREAAEQQEDARERAALCVGDLEDVPFDLVHVERVCVEEVGQGVEDGIGVRFPCYQVAVVGDTDQVDAALLSQYLLEVAEEHDCRGRVPRVAAFFEDAGHGYDHRDFLEEEGYLIPCVGAQLLSSLGAEVRLAGAERPQVEFVSVLVEVTVEPGHLRRAEALDAEPWFAPLGDDCDGGNVEADGRSHAVDRRVSERVTDGGGGIFRNEPGPAGGFQLIREDDFVYLADLCERLHAYGVRERVARSERRREEQRRKHQAQHDEGRLRPPSGDVAGRHLQDDRVPQRDNRCQRERNRQNDREVGGERTDGDAEEGVHPLVPLPVFGHHLIALDQAVAHVDHAPCPRADRRVVRYQHEGLLLLLIEPAQEVHDELARLAVQRARGARPPTRWRVN